LKPNSDRFSEFGSENGLDLFKKGNIYWEFQIHANALAQHQKQTLHSNWEKLWQAIQNKLNSSFKGHGFPHGLTPHCASSFGIENLLNNLNRDVHITFTEAISHENDQNLVNDEPVYNQGYIQSWGEPEITGNATEEAEQSASTLLDVAQTAREPENCFAMIAQLQWQRCLYLILGSYAFLLNSSSRL